MIEELLAFLNRGGVTTVAQMARQLDTTPALVEQMIEHLGRLGRIQPLGVTCGTTCGGCALASACGVKLWTRMNTDERG